MGSIRAAGVDRAALFGAVEEKRRTEGLSWRAVATETGVSVSTIKRMATAEVSEADGVLAVAIWLGRNVSQFAA